MYLCKTLMSVLIQVLRGNFHKMYFILSFAQSVLLYYKFGQLTTSPYLSVLDVDFYILPKVIK